MIVVTKRVTMNMSISLIHVIVYYKLNIGLFLTISEERLIVKVLINMNYVMLPDVQLQVEEKEYSPFMVKLDSLFYPIQYKALQMLQISAKILVVLEEYFTIPLNVDLNLILYMIGLLLIFFIEQIYNLGLLQQDVLAHYVLTGIVRLVYLDMILQDFYVQLHKMIMIEHTDVVEIFNACRIINHNYNKMLSFLLLLK